MARRRQRESTLQECRTSCMRPLTLPSLAHTPHCPSTSFSNAFWRSARSPCSRKRPSSSSTSFRTSSWSSGSCRHYATTNPPSKAFRSASLARRLPYCLVRRASRRASGDSRQCLVQKAAQWSRSKFSFVIFRLKCPTLCSGLTKRRSSRAAVSTIFAFRAPRSPRMSAGLTASRSLLGPRPWPAPIPAAPCRALPRRRAPRRARPPWAPALAFHDRGLVGVDVLLPVELRVPLEPRADRVDSLSPTSRAVATRRSVSARLRAILNVIAADAIGRPVGTDPNGIEATFKPACMRIPVIPCDLCVHRTRQPR